jgi:hypothetical protein
MSNRDRVRQLERLRDTACGVGTRLVKIRLNKLAKTEPLALAARLALEIEDANIQAKKYRGSKWMDRNYRKKQELIGDLITLFRHQEWAFGVHQSEHRFERGVIYFEIPGCEQISFHYDHEGPSLPTYEKPWDEKRDSTMPKLLEFIEQEFCEVISGMKQAGHPTRAEASSGACPLFEIPSGQSEP